MDTENHHTSRRGWLTWYRLLMSVALIALVCEAVRVLVLTNRHTVIPGKVYRCSQPSGSSIRELANQHNIRTVINLRGVSPEISTYRDEAQACMELGLSQEDITLSAQSLPPRSEIRQIVEVLDRTEYPALIHCKAGADRTGLVSAMTLLLYTDESLDQARKQLWPRFGHFRFGRTAAMDEFYDQYETWLNQNNQRHTQQLFRHWLLVEYSPGPAQSQLEFVSDTTNVQKADEAFNLTIRATNQSKTPWEFKTGMFSGVHVSYRVYNEADIKAYVEKGQPYKAVIDTRAGFRESVIPPGGSIEVVLPLIGLPPGKYIVTAELHDARQAGIPFRTNSFVKFGDRSVEARITVR